MLVVVLEQDGKYLAGVLVLVVLVAVVMERLVQLEDLELQILEAAVVLLGIQAHQYFQVVAQADLA
jgi:hypothetical protein